MKKSNKNNFIRLLLTWMAIVIANSVSAQEDSVVSKELVKLKYFNDNNSMQFLLLEHSLKTGKKIEPLKNKVFLLYLDSIKADDIIARVTTENTGKAKAFLPPTLKAAWEAKAVHKFIAVAEGEEEPAMEVEMTKAKIKIDTVAGNESKSVAVEVMKFENGEWVPAPEVELKIGVRRHGGILSAGDEEIYTTDSSGIATVEFKKDRLPGDGKGNIILVAKVEENDLFGNLLVEKAVPWGIAVKGDGNFFDKRSLWSTRIRTPWWLLVMAYSIVVGVWGTIFYLVFQIARVKKLGSSAS